MNIQQLKMAVVGSTRVLFRPKQVATARTKQIQAWSKYLSTHLREIPNVQSEGCQPKTIIFISRQR